MQADGENPLAEEKYYFQTQIEQAKSAFSGAFRENRKFYDQLRQRKLAVVLPEEIVAGEDYYQYKTPDLEKAAGDWADIAATNPTIFDLIVLDQAQEAKEQGRDILMWLARGWELENEARWWDRSVVGGQVNHGVKVMRFCYHPQKEFAPEDGDAKAVLKARDQKQRRRRYPFYWQECDVQGVAWLGDERTEEGPSFFVYEAEVPYLEAAGRYKKDGMKFGLHDGRLGWAGQDQALGGSTTLETIKVTTIDALDPGGDDCKVEGCEHTGRKIYVYCSGMGEELSADNLFDEYDSPFPGCSFFIIAGRHSDDHDMDTRFLPMLKPMYVEAEPVNYLSTLLYAMIRGDYGPEGYYINFANADPRNMPEGPDKIFDFSLPKEGKIQGFPGPVERMPRGLSPHLPTEITLHRERMINYMPNRHLTGTADSEASNATGTAFLVQTQQANLPVNGLLSQSDAAILKSRKYVVHAIKYWGLTDVPGAETKWYAVMTGNNRNIQVKGKQAKHGEVFWVDAKKIDLDFDLQTLTKSETLAEQQARWLLGYDQYSKGAISADQLFRMAGIDDIEGHKEQLRAAETYGLMLPTVDSLKRAAMMRIISVFMGIDPAMIQSLPVNQEAGAEAEGPGGGAGGGLGGTNHYSMIGQQAAAQGRSSRDVSLAVNGAGGVAGPTGGASPMGG